jgi:hypothetical protein
LDDSNRGNATISEIKSEQLVGLSSAILAYNYVESLMDALLGLSLRLHPGLFVDDASRINGMEGKVEIIRRSAEVNYQLPAISFDPINATLSAVGAPASAMPR